MGKPVSTAKHPSKGVNAPLLLCQKAIALLSLIGKQRKQQLLKILMQYIAFVYRLSHRLGINRETCTTDFRPYASESIFSYLLFKDVGLPIVVWPCRT